MQSARRLIQAAAHFHLLAFELLGFVLIINLVRAAARLQNVLVSGLHHGTGEGLGRLR